ncbi:hypothetical protein NL676_025325 [Syzygium grande]|nr:hypothetical protein NL676_025325 [Syzygium grande]
MAESVPAAAWMLAMLAAFSLAHCIDDKCAACNAVAGELEIGLSNEKPRNHLDMRHRLDSRGQRKESSLIIGSAS